MTRTWQVNEVSRDLGIVSVRHISGSGMKRRTLFDEDIAAGEDVLEVLLNLKGMGFLKHAGLRLALEPQTIAISKAGGKTQHWRRDSAQGHEWLSFKFSGEFLRNQLGDMRFHLRQDVRGALFDEYGASPLFVARPFAAKTSAILKQLLGATRKTPAFRLKSRALCLELIADFIFREQDSAEQGTAFCELHRRQTCAKVERARQIIDQSFREPLTLEFLSKRVGSSPSHLSRTFSQQTGMKLTHYLRLVRLRHARQQLISGHCNVTEAALDSGFNHLSHFAKAFQSEFGYKPSELIRQGKLG